MIASERGRHPHEDFDELAVGWALDALEPDDEVMFARHLAGCGRCRQTVTEAHEVTSAITNALPAEAPPAALRDRILAAASVEAQQAPRSAYGARVREDSIELAGEAGTGPRRVLHRGGPAATDWSGQRRAALYRRRRRQRRRGLIRGAGVAAVLAMVVGLGVWNVELRSERSDLATVADSQRAALRELGDNGVYRVAPMTDPDNRRLGSVVIHDDRATVLAEGFEPNDVTNQTFVLWGMGGDQLVALGTFDVLTTGLSTRAVQPTTTDLDAYSGYAISLEAGRQAPSAPSVPLASGAVGS